MKSNFTTFNVVRLIFGGSALLILPWIGTVRTQAQTQGQLTERPAPPSRPVSSGNSVMVKNATVYSIQFPGGTAGDFFEFLRTNGFVSDNVLFAGKAASTQISSFTLRHVRLTDIGKALELLSEGRLSVEVVEKGEQSDENIWRIKVAPDTAKVVTRSCAMPHFLRRPDAVDRLEPIVNAAERELEKGLIMAGGLKRSGHTHMMGPEKIVIVVGPVEYVDAVSSALEAAEKVAVAHAEALNPK
jgi:hypothetical protein